MEKATVRAEENVSSIDRILFAQLGRFTLGLSPAALILAYLDWLVHLAFAPGKKTELVEKSLRKMLRFAPLHHRRRDQNAIDLAHVLGIESPRVAILSAVETVTAKLRSTLDAAALCKMADRGQITGGVVDGPLAFDNAVSEEAAQIKAIASPVAGRADILVVPDLEAGNMLVKQLGYLAEAQGAGIVLGARIPIILTSRADTVLARMASCAVALVAARRGRLSAP